MTIDCEDTPAPTCDLMGRVADAKAAQDQVEALEIERDALGACNDRLRAELDAVEKSRRELRARVGELEALVALYARNGVQA